MQTEFSKRLDSPIQPFSRVSVTQDVLWNRLRTSEEVASAGQQISVNHVEIRTLGVGELNVTK